MSRYVSLVLAVGLGAALSSIFRAVMLGHERPIENTQTSLTNVAPRSLLHQMAPSLFPMTKSGTIDFPPSVKYVVIDIGARGSDYLKTLEQSALDHEDTAVILVDPLPDSYIPLMQRVADYQLRNSTKHWMHPLFSNQVFLIKGAMGPSPGDIEFHVGTSPACGSILETSAANKFWCAKSQKSILTLMYTLEDLLALIPSTIAQVHVKVDAEGADLFVLRGAGEEQLQRVHTVVHECIDETVEVNLTIHQGGCINKDSIAFMTARNFRLANKDNTKGFNNLFFSNRKYDDLPLPSFLLQSTIDKVKFYQSLDAERKKDATGIRAG